MAFIPQKPFGLIRNTFDVTMCGLVQRKATAQYVSLAYSNNPDSEPIVIEHEGYMFICPFTKTNSHFILQEMANLLLI